jgi:hypothetical protein
MNNLELGQGSMNIDRLKNLLESLGLQVMIKNEEKPNFEAEEHLKQINSFLDSADDLPKKPIKQLFCGENMTEAIHCITCDNLKLKTSIFILFKIFLI